MQVLLFVSLFSFQEFAQVEERALSKTWLAGLHVRCDIDDQDINFFLYHICIYKDVVDDINDAMLSSFHFTVCDHESFVQCQKSDSKILELFRKMQSCSLSAESELENLLHPSFYKTWKLKRKMKDADKTDENIKKELMVEEMDPTRLVKWLLERPGLNVYEKMLLEETISMKKSSRRQKMQNVLGILEGLEKGQEQLKLYCAENVPYVYSKVYEKYKQLPSHEDQTTKWKQTLSYEKGGGLQHLFSFWTNIGSDSKVKQVDISRKLEKGINPSHEYTTDVSTGERQNVEQKEAVKDRSSEFSHMSGIFKQFQLLPAKRDTDKKDDLEDYGYMVHMTPLFSSNRYINRYVYSGTVRSDVCLLKCYAYIKTTMSKEQTVAINQHLRLDHCISFEENKTEWHSVLRRYNLYHVPRRNLIESLLKAVITEPSKSLVAFYDITYSFCPDIARTLAETKVTNDEWQLIRKIKSEPLRFSRRKRLRAEEHSCKDLYCDYCNENNIVYCMSSLPKDLDNLADIMLSRLLFSIWDHSEIIKCQSKDDKLNAFFEVMYERHLNPISESPNSRKMCEEMQNWIESMTLISGKKCDKVDTKPIIHK
ncbi:hypothetical protein CHS0354_005876 [Potamilus streckersoni]|uniref:CARD domain-containing protein n=1 Tax=Potamilus streckersoni TaxID=2493646 RepID=A0AAE0T867_9BIVA|nr:hypothetical protein CHS0354_005876 [Potamilus streckersoni]